MIAFQELKTEPFLPFYLTLPPWFFNT